VDQYLPPPLDKPAPLNLPALLEEGSGASAARIAHLAGALYSATPRLRDPALHETLALLYHETDALTQLGRSIGELNRIQQQASPLRFEPIELGDLLMSIMPEWKARAPHHSLELALPGELPSVLASLPHTARAMSTLIEAAVALAAEESSVRVSIRPQLDEVRVSVQYQGTTLSSTDLEHLFEPFYQPEGRPGFRVGGGLGLTLAQAILYAHGGRLQVENGTEHDGGSLIAQWPLLPSPPPEADASPLIGDGVAGNQNRFPTPSDVTIPGGSGRRLTRVTGRPVILVLDADTRMLRYLRANLDAQRFKPVLARDTQEVFRLVDLEEPDLLLLDLGAVAQSTTSVDELLLELQSLVSAPIICLDAAGDPLECARLLELGVFDYLAKPFCLEELLARIRVALRTQQALARTPPRELRFQSGELTIDFEERSVMVGERQVALSKTEYKLLRVLAEHAGMVLSHEALLSRVWGPGYSEEVEFVWVYIRRLRKKIEPDPGAPTYIQTVPGVGYRMVRR
jgi:DNA-binding response OmpR family regulator